MRMMMRKEDAGNEVPLPRSFIILREKERFELIRSTKFPMICHGGGEVKKQSAEVTLEQSLRRMNNEMRFTMIQGNENVRFVAPIGSHVG